MTYDGTDANTEEKPQISNLADYVGMKKREKLKRLEKEKKKKPRPPSRASSPEQHEGKCEDEQWRERRRALSPGWQGVTDFIMGDPRTRRYVQEQFKIISKREKKARKLAHSEVRF